MDKREISMGILAIPLRTDSSSNLGNLSPNYFIIEGLESIVANNAYTSTGELEKTDGLNLKYSLKKNEILEATTTKEEELSEITILQETIVISVDFIPLIASHQRIKANLETVNSLLNLFSFRGSLLNLKLEIDESILDEILLLQI